jgi:aspartate carbamoyltransferase catalytic subunit
MRQHAQQYNAKGELCHLLTLEDVPRAIIQSILDLSESFLGVVGRDIKKVPLLRGKSVFNVFFEPSTRTRMTFEIAALRLSADVLNLDIPTSSQVKGESLLDTIANLAAMQADIFVIRHQQSGAAHLIAQHAAPHIHVINAGDGRHAHPTQALLDLFTIRHYKKDFKGLSVAIIGDVLHSRVARSEIHGLKAMGVDDIRVVGPKTLVPPSLEHLGVRVFHQLAKGIAGADVIVCLRLQTERMHAAYLPSLAEYFKLYGIDEEKLQYAEKDVIVMHPGPMNRGVEIDSSIADGPYAVILSQVHFGIAVRMAVMSTLVNK